MKIRKITVVVSVALFILCSLFPPWIRTGTLSSGGGENEGYTWLWNAVREETVDMHRLFIEWACIAAVAGAVWFCTSKPKTG